MTTVGPRARRSAGAAPRAVAVMGAAVLAATALGGCGGGDRSASLTSVSVPSLPTPMATSVQTSAGTWVTLPMGHLDQPGNTFWQLLFRHRGAGKWSNKVEATATATNGGLVLATAGGPDLTVAVRPSADLTFTPLISTSGAGGAWSNGLVGLGVEARPDAVAVSAGGDALALVKNRGTASVLSTPGDLSQWEGLVSAPSLGATRPGRSCGLGALTAVGYSGREALIGGSCARPGVVGIFAPDGKTWRLAGPELSPSLRRGHSEVLALGGTAGGAYALVAVAGARRTDLVAGWLGANGRWSTSAGFPLPAGQRVASFGPAGGDDVFVLLEGASGGPDHLVVAAPSSAAWAQLPDPPGGTATVAFVAGAPVQAMVAQGSKLTVFALKATSRQWAATQVMNVDIQYGSSS